MTQPKVYTPPRAPGQGQAPGLTAPNVPTLGDVLEQEQHGGAPTAGSGMGSAPAMGTNPMPPPATFSTTGGALGAGAGATGGAAAGSGQFNPLSVLLGGNGGANAQAAQQMLPKVMDFIMNVMPGNSGQTGH